VLLNKEADRTLSHSPSNFNTILTSYTHCQRCIVLWDLKYPKISHKSDVWITFCVIVIHTSIFPIRQPVIVYQSKTSLNLVSLTYWVRTFI